MNLLLRARSDIGNNQTNFLDNSGTLMIYQGGQHMQDTAIEHDLGVYIRARDKLPHGSQGGYQDIIGGVTGPVS